MTVYAGSRRYQRHKDEVKCRLRSGFSRGSVVLPSPREVSTRSKSESQIANATACSMVNPYTSINSLPNTPFNPSAKQPYFPISRRMHFHVGIVANPSVIFSDSTSRVTHHAGAIPSCASTGVPSLCRLTLRFGKENLMAVMPIITANK